MARLLCSAAAAAACSDLGAQFAMALGACSMEISPAGYNRRTALSLFMQQAPFASRIPVLVGDDAMDESAFEFVNDSGGISIKAGAKECAAAHYRLPVAHDVVTWLESLATHRAGGS